MGGCGVGGKLAWDERGGGGGAVSGWEEGVWTFGM